MGVCLLILNSKFHRSPLWIWAGHRRFPSLILIHLQLQLRVSTTFLTWMSSYLIITFGET